MKLISYSLHKLNTFKMRQFIRFFSLMLVVSLFFWNCERETSMDVQLPDRVTNLADFDQFVQAQVHPFDQLSEETINEFKTKLIFTPDHQIAGGYMASVQEELSAADFNLFMRFVLGADSNAANAAEYEEFELESRGCVHRPLYLPNYRNEFPWGCVYDLGNFCTICRDNHQ